MKYSIYILIASCINCFSAGLLSMPGTLENITPSPIRGLVAYWNFDGATLSNDVSYTVAGSTRTIGTGTNHLTMVGNVGSSSGVVGNSSIHTNNVNNYWKIPNASAKTLAQESSNCLTCISWVYPRTTTTGRRAIIGKGYGSGNESWQVILDNELTGKVDAWSTISENGVSARSLAYLEKKVNLSNWNFIVMGVTTGRTHFLYANITNYFAAANAQPTNYSSTVDFNIASTDNSTSQILNGSVDECGIWSGSRGGLSPTLTTNELRFLWNNGLGRKFPFNSGSGP